VSRACAFKASAMRASNVEVAGEFRVFLDELEAQFGLAASANRWFGRRSSFVDR
jgi:hypothetical protein